MTESPLERLLDSGAPLPQAVLHAAMESDDLADQALAERAIRGAWTRIVPPLDRDTSDRFLVRFYLRSLHSAVAIDCGAENSEQLRAGLDAAIKLRELLEAWVDAAHPPHSSIDYLVDQVTRAFSAADILTRGALEWLFLAPALEHEAIVPIFEAWRGGSDPALAAALDEAYAYAGDRPRQDPPQAAKNHPLLERYRDAALAIPLAELRGLMSSADLVDNAAAADLLTTRWAQIAPAPDAGEARRFLIDFLLRAMIENRPLPYDAGSADDCVPTRFEAAARLQTLLEHLVDRTSKREAEVAYLVRRVTDEFLAGDETLRNAIETGFLEHVLERTDLVDLFAHWQQHTQLADSYEWALKWGLAHRRAPGGAD